MGSAAVGRAYMRVLSSASATGPSLSSPGAISDGVPGSSRCGSAMLRRLIARRVLDLVVPAKELLLAEEQRAAVAIAWLTFPRTRMRPASSPLARSSTDTY